MLIRMNERESAEKTKDFIFNYLLELDRNLFVNEGPYESFNIFLYNYGYQWSKHIMEEILPTKVFTKRELEILTKIENHMMELINNYDTSNIQGWNFLKKDEYLKLKELSYEYIKLIQESKDEW